MIHLSTFTSLLIGYYGVIGVLSISKTLGNDPHKVIQKLAILGFVLLLVGFLLQFIEACNRPN